MHIIFYHAINTCKTDFELQEKAKEIGNKTKKTEQNIMMTFKFVRNVRLQGKIYVVKSSMKTGN